MMNMQRTYFPRHLLPVAAATAASNNAPARWLVGWRTLADESAQQVCVATSVQHEMQVSPQAAHTARGGSKNDTRRSLT